MTRYDRRVHFLAAGLAALAGYVDATGYIALGGYFVSFMSGNSTRFGVGLALDRAQAAIAGGLIGGFLSGVILGALVGRAAGPRRRPAVLLTVAALLAFAAAVGGRGALAPAAAAMAIAMGVENAVFERDGEVSIGLTYMTGSLVKLGQRVAAALTGGPPLAWLPYLMLWAGFIAGAVVGAAADARLGFAGLWLAALAAAAFAAAAARLGPDRAEPDRAA